MSSPRVERACWCGHPELAPYSADYHVCRACGTLVSRAPVPIPGNSEAPSAASLYNHEYWSKRQTEHHGLPDIQARARLDLPERCTHWLRHLLTHRLPPARVLEIGCAHGGYLSLLTWAGFQTVGTEMSPQVVQFARDTFGAAVLCGTIEQQKLPPASFDVIVLNDVLEHLPDPLGTLQHCVPLLSPGGFFVIQTPEYKEHLTHADLVAAKDLFLRHMDNNNDEHLYLFSRRSVGALFARLGFPLLAFANPVYSYDMFFTASREKLPVHDDAAIAQALTSLPAGRMALALLDKAYESNDRWWAIQRLEAELKKR